MKTVYLAGPIMGCDDDGANLWRYDVAHQLEQYGIRGVSPLRCEPLVGKVYGDVYQADPRFGTARAIGSKNVYDVRTCDMGIYYLPRPADPPPGWHQSWGTMQEMAWSYILGKGTILVSNDTQVLSHPVIQANASWIVETLDEAVETCAGVLGGYTLEGKHV